MQRSEGSTRKKMEELRLVCDREVPIQQQRIESALVTLRNSLESTKAKAHETVQNQAKLGKLKAQLRKEEDTLVKALAVKTRKEKKRIGTVDSLAATRTRIAELKRIVEDQRIRKDEYATIISQQKEVVESLEAKCGKDTEYKENMEEAISWYNRVLGFRIECGHGVKFIFTNINLTKPKEEYSFTIRHKKDIYTLLDCQPHLKDTKELIHELNKSNGLFKFVRTMREKFQEAAASGNCFPQFTSIEETSTISLSAPASSVSTESRSEALPKQQEVQPGETNKNLGKISSGRGANAALFSPGSASSLRRSPRFKVKK